MKKLLAIMVLSLLLSGNAYADPTKFKCINKDGTEREYILSIDLKKEEIKLAGTHSQDSHRTQHVEIEYRIIFDFIDLLR